MDNSVLEKQDVEGLSVEGSILRPRPKSPDIVDQFLQEAESNPSGKNDTPYLFVPWCRRPLQY